MNAKRMFVLVAGWFVCTLAASAVSEGPAPRAAAPQAAATAPAAQRALLDQYCVRCHNARLQSGKFRLDDADVSTVTAHSETWEKVVRKLRGGVMPPPGQPRPDKATYVGLATWLEGELDRAAVTAPNPGRTE